MPFPTSVAIRVFMTGETPTRRKPDPRAHGRDSPGVDPWRAASVPRRSGCCASLAPLPGLFNQAIETRAKERQTERQRVKPPIAQREARPRDQHDPETTK